MKTKLLIVTVFLVFCFSGSCLANPVTPFPSLGGTFAINTWSALLIDGVVDFLALLIGYLIIRNTRAMASFVFLPYFGLVFLGGIIIDIASVIPVVICSFLLPSVDGLNMLEVFIFAGLLLYLYNGFLSKKFLKLEGNQTRVIGIVMGILTNPLIGSLFFSSIRGWR